MSKITEQSLRDRYFFNDLFKIGDIVECMHTSAKYQILNRGSNYVTVANESGETQKKWLHEITEYDQTELVLEKKHRHHGHVTPNKDGYVARCGGPRFCPQCQQELNSKEEENETPAQEAGENEAGESSGAAGSSGAGASESVEKDDNFEILESGQIKIFGYETRNLNKDISEFIIEQFNEFDDLYSKHQIIKCLDFALHENDTSRAYELLDKVSNFYIKQNVSTPLIVEIAKNDTERTRVAEIIAAIAGIKVSSANSQTVTDSIKALREKYQNRKQWEVLFPLLKLAKDIGLYSAVQNLPYNISSTVTESEKVLQISLEVYEENLAMLVDDLEYEDVVKSLKKEDITDLQLSEEILNSVFASKSKTTFEMFLTAPESISALMERSLLVAETLIKRKLLSNISLEEKESFLVEISKNKSIVPKLAQLLIPKLKSLQEKSICWKGYKRKPKTKPYEAGSCVKIDTPVVKK
jgi:hypothetical protein